MAETPKTREELIDLAVECKFSRAEVSDFIGCIESHGLRIVPVEPTNEMLYEADHGLGVAKQMWTDALSKNPFAPEKDDG
jgi:hypothetical protein